MTFIKLVITKSNSAGMITTIYELVNRLRELYITDIFKKIDLSFFILFNPCVWNITNRGFRLTILFRVVVFAY